MNTGIRTGSIVGENIAANSVTKDQNLWISKQKQLCWKCQKDVPRSHGTSSFLIKPQGRIPKGTTAPQKFICFDCNPKEQLS